MDPERTVRDLIQRFFLRTGQVIREVSRVEEGFLIRSDRFGWHVTVAFRSDEDGPDVFAVFDVRPTAAADPPPPPHGFAVFADGRIYRLRDPDRFSRFFDQAKDSISPINLMSLLTRYQGGEAPQTPIIDRETISFWLSPDQLDGVSGFTLPVYEAWAGEEKSLTFCALSIDIGSPIHRPRFGLIRWEVKKSVGSGLSWTTSVLTRNSEIQQPPIRGK